MCDEDRLKLQAQINEQSDIVRKLKATKGNKDKVSKGDFAFHELSDVIQAGPYAVEYTFQFNQFL
jgi:hypothetical protein